MGINGFRATFVWIDEIQKWEEAYKNLSDEERRALYETRPAFNEPEEYRWIGSSPLLD